MATLPKLPLAITAVALAASGTRAADQPPDFSRDLQPYLDAYCLRCHDAQKQKGDFRIDSLSREIGQKDTPQWAEIMSRISSGEMPPKKEEKQPPATESARVVEWLSARIKEGEAARMAKRDRVSFHRLSREEYVHTVYDLLGVHVDANDPGGFQEDPEWHGFERLGSVLPLSASQMEKYFQFAEKILSEAYPEKAPVPLELKRKSVQTTQITGKYREYLESQGLLDKVRYDLWPGDIFRAGGPGGIKSAGVYECKITLSGLKKPGGPAPRVRFYEENLDRVLFEQDVVAPEDQPVTLTFRTHLPAGSPTVHVYNHIAGPSTLPRFGRHGNRPFVSLAEGRLPWQLKLTDEEGVPLYSFLIIDEVEWKGPLVSDAEAALRAPFLPADNNPEQVAKALRAFADRAFRRPATAAELAKITSIVQKELDSGTDVKTAVKHGMIAILCSRNFIFLHEGSEDRERHTLNDWELASRLAYMLWSTMPDAELTALAAAGKLQDRAELKKQVTRMLADPRATRFAQSFPFQWLQLRKVGMFAPDKKLYPEYDKHLEQSMIAETTAFFAETLTKNLPLSELLQSNWTMLNPRLARHYGLEEPARDAFERVSLRADSHRGGILTHAGILSLTSDGTRHRPVHRGVWISESIFGKSPPPPPANVEPIAPNPVDSPKATLRMKLDAHKANENCAACHARIDPLGLAFENYDAIGRWRTREQIQQGTGDDPEVDASGHLPDGRTYRDAEDLKRLLLADLDVFNKTFIRKLGTYALRRSLSFEDEERLATIAAEAKKAGYGVRSILETLITSDLFQAR
jgi:hypothetical protein